MIFDLFWGMRGGMDRLWWIEGGVAMTMGWIGGIWLDTCIFDARVGSRYRKREIRVLGRWKNGRGGLY